MAGGANVMPFDEIPCSVHFHALQDSLSRREMSRAQGLGVTESRDYSRDI